MDMQFIYKANELLLSQFHQEHLQLNKVLLQRKYQNLKRRAEDDPVKMQTLQQILNPI